MTQHETLAGALAAFQAELPKLVKDEKAKVKGTTKDGRDYDRSYGYADLAQVVETVLPVLGKHGLSITSQTAFADNGMFILEVKLLHSSGQYETAVWPLPAPGSGVGPQDVGSAMTYGRRYLTLALSGAYPGGEDDDGARAQSRAESWDNAKPAQASKPFSAPPAPPKKEWTDADVFGYQAKISSSDVTLAVKGYDWMASNNLHERKVDYPTGDALTATQVLAFRLADLAVQPEADLSAIAVIRANAEDRGLLGTKVSDSTTLGEELALASDTLKDKAAEQEPVV